MAKRRRRRGIQLGEVSKKDFVAIAEILCETHASSATKERLASYFGSQNPRFDQDRFLRTTHACKV
jgi:hypothetical protein